MEIKFDAPRNLIELAKKPEVRICMAMMGITIEGDKESDENLVKYFENFILDYMNKNGIEIKKDPEVSN